MALRNAHGFPERTSLIQHYSKSSIRHTLTVQHPGYGVDHHDAGVGPQKRAVERGVLLQIGQARSPANHSALPLLNTDHQHLSLIITLIKSGTKAHTSAVIIVRSRKDVVDSILGIVTLNIPVYLPVVLTCILLLQLCHPAPAPITR